MWCPRRDVLLILVFVHSIYAGASAPIRNDNNKCTDDSDCSRDGSRWCQTLEIKMQPLGAAAPTEDDTVTGICVDNKCGQGCQNGGKCVRSQCQCTGGNSGKHCERNDMTPCNEGTPCTGGFWCRDVCDGTDQKVCVQYLGLGATCGATAKLACKQDKCHPDLLCEEGVCVEKLCYTPPQHGCTRNCTINGKLTCIDDMHDNLHCGRCDNPCSTGTSCHNGECTVFCGDNMVGAGEQCDPPKSMMLCNPINRDQGYATCTNECKIDKSHCLTPEDGADCQPYKAWVPQVLETPAWFGEMHGVTTLEFNVQCEYGNCGNYVKEVKVTIKNGFYFPISNSRIVIESPSGKQLSLADGDFWRDVVTPDNCEQAAYFNDFVFIDGITNNEIAFRIGDDTAYPILEGAVKPKEPLAIFTGDRPFGIWKLHAMDDERDPYTKKKRIGAGYIQNVDIEVITSCSGGGPGPAEKCEVEYPKCLSTKDCPSMGEQCFKGICTAGCIALDGVTFIFAGEPDPTCECCVCPDNGAGNPEGLVEKPAFEPTDCEYPLKRMQSDDVCKPSECGFDCAAGKIFKKNYATCQSTCRSTVATCAPDTKDKAGCACPPGTVLNEETNDCVPPSQCSISAQTCEETKYDEIGSTELDMRVAVRAKEFLKLKFKTDSKMCQSLNVIICVDETNCKDGGHLGSAAMTTEELEEAGLTTETPELDFSETLRELAQPEVTVSIRVTPGNHTMDNCVRSIWAGTIMIEKDSCSNYPACNSDNDCYMGEHCVPENEDTHAGKCQPITECGPHLPCGDRQTCQDLPWDDCDPHKAALATVLPECRGKCVSDDKKCKPGMIWKENARCQLYCHNYGEGCQPTPQTGGCICPDDKAFLDENNNCVSLEDCHNLVDVSCSEQEPCTEPGEYCDYTGSELGKLGTCKKHMCHVIVDNVICEEDAPNAKHYPLGAQWSASDTVNVCNCILQSDQVVPRCETTQDPCANEKPKTYHPHGKIVQFAYRRTCKHPDREDLEPKKAELAVEKRGIAGGCVCPTNLFLQDNNDYHKYGHCVEKCPQACPEGEQWSYASHCAKDCQDVDEHQENDEKIAICNVAKLEGGCVCNPGFVRDPKQKYACVKPEKCYKEKCVDHDGKTWKVGAKVELEDGCNTCECNVYGEYVCTTKTCANCPYDERMIASHLRRQHPSTDGCNHFRCLDGKVVPVTENPCKMCKDANSISHPSDTKVEFDAHDGCNKCKCLDGKITCSANVCKPCNYFGEEITSGERFIAKDRCNKCTCKNGVTSCTEKACRSCDVKRWKCELGEMCTEHNTIYESGKGWAGEDGCKTCVCVDGEQQCKFTRGLSSCSNCAANQNREMRLTHAFKRYRHTDQCNLCTCVNGVEECTDLENCKCPNTCKYGPKAGCVPTCRNPNPDCTQEQAALLGCVCENPRHVRNDRGFCVPQKECTPDDYDPCIYNGREYPSGSNDIAKGDKCNQGTCRNGNIAWTEEVCTCDLPNGEKCNRGSHVENEEDGCSKWICSHDGVLTEDKSRCNCATSSADGLPHNDGTRWRDITGCKQCRCERGQEICAEIQCPAPLCPKPITVRGVCCPSCPPGCFDDKNGWADAGSDWSIDECTTATCKISIHPKTRATVTDIVIKTEECPETLTYPNGEPCRPVKDKDTCCARCGKPCTVELDGTSVEKLHFHRWLVPGTCGFAMCNDGTVVTTARPCACSYNGQTHQHNCPPFSAGDHCENTCTCTDGKVTCTQKNCGCLWKNNVIANGKTFFMDDCTKCQCVNNKARCDDLSTKCSMQQKVCTGEKVPGKCCTRCFDSCQESDYFDATVVRPRSHGTTWGRMCKKCSCHDGTITCDDTLCGCYQRNADNRVVQYGNGEKWVLEDNKCTQCTCSSDKISCTNLKPNCPTLNCKHQVMSDDGCCMRCGNTCQYEGNSYASHDVWNKATDDCNDCSCEDGEITCGEDPCECTYDGKMYANRADWKVNDCVSCHCNAGTVEEKDEQPNCPKPQCDADMLISVAGQCCPRCPNSCSFKEDTLAHGKTADAGDDCNDCTCKDGEISCTENTCACRDRGMTYPNNEWWMRDACTKCHCERGRIEFHVTTVEEHCSLTCDNSQWIEQEDECCPRCPNSCSVGNTKYAHGSNNIISNDGCNKCECVDGEITNCTEEKCDEESPCDDPRAKGRACEPVCEGGCNEENNGGRCLENGRCSCHIGWQGKQCREKYHICRATGSHFRLFLPADVNPRNPGKERWWHFQPETVKIGDVTLGTVHNMEIKLSTYKCGKRVTCVDRATILHKGENPFALRYHRERPMSMEIDNFDNIEEAGYTINIRGKYNKAIIKTDTHRIILSWRTWWSRPRPNKERPPKETRLDVKWIVYGAEDPVKNSGGCCMGIKPREPVEETDPEDACREFMDPALQVIKTDDDCCGRYQHCPELHKACQYEQCSSIDNDPLVSPTEVPQLCIPYEPVAEDEGECHCNDTRHTGETCNDCVANYYTPPMCNTFCDPEVTCKQFAARNPTCNNNGQCECEDNLLCDEACVTKKGETKHNGAVWKADACSYAFCAKGKVRYSTKQCKPLACDEHLQIIPEGKCCARCLLQCKHAGKMHIHGTTFQSEDGCNTCTCKDGFLGCTKKICDPVCPPGRRPPTCEPICDGGCVHGKCMDVNECQCDKGWGGPACDQTANNCAGWGDPHFRRFAVKAGASGARFNDHPRTWETETDALAGTVGDVTIKFHTWNCAKTRTVTCLDKVIAHSSPAYEGTPWKVEFDRKRIGVADSTETITDAGIELEALKKHRVIKQANGKKRTLTSTHFILETDDNRHQLLIGWGGSAKNPRLEFEWQTYGFEYNQDIKPNGGVCTGEHQNGEEQNPCTGASPAVMAVVTRCCRPFASCDDPFYKESCMYDMCADIPHEASIDEASDYCDEEVQERHIQTAKDIDECKCPPGRRENPHTGECTWCIDNMYPVGVCDTKCLDAECKFGGKCNVKGKCMCNGHPCDNVCMDETGDTKAPGMTWPNEQDDCKISKCDNGKVVTRKKVCPKLRCTKHQTTDTPSGECCARCVNKCTTHNGMVNHKAKFLGKDKCSNCECFDGKVTCNTPEKCKDITEVHTVTACEGYPLSISCRNRGNGRIHIIDASYGRSVPYSQQCAYKNITRYPDARFPTLKQVTDCKSTSSESKVASYCHNKRDCQVHSTNSVFGDPCVWTYKYLEIQYACDCPAQYEGKMCTPVCEAGCVHGSCSRPNVCTCNRGWYGPACDRPKLSCGAWGDPHFLPWGSSVMVHYHPVTPRNEEVSLGTMPSGVPDENGVYPDHIQVLIGTWDCSVSTSRKVTCIDRVIVRDASGQNAWKYEFSRHRKLQWTGVGEEKCDLDVIKSGSTVYVKNEQHNLKISWVLPAGSVKVYRPRLDVYWEIFGLDTSDKDKINGMCVNKKSTEVTNVGTHPCEDIKKKTGLYNQIKQCCEKYEHCPEIYEDCLYDTCQGVTPGATSCDCVDYNDVARMAEECHCESEHAKGACDECQQGWYDAPGKPAGDCSIHCVKEKHCPNGKCNANGECECNGRPCEEAPATTANICYTVDNFQRLYVNGKMIHEDVKNQQWWTPICKDVLIPDDGPYVVSIAGIDNGWIAGILAQETNIAHWQTDGNNWKCKSLGTEGGCKGDRWNEDKCPFPKEWTEVDFDDSEWEPPVFAGGSGVASEDSASNGVKPWNEIHGIRRTAKWIWAGHPVNDLAVMCRLNLRPNWGKKDCAEGKGEQCEDVCEDCAHGKCQEGKCECDDGWTGANCNKQVFTCRANGACKFDPFGPGPIISHYQPHSSKLGNILLGSVGGWTVRMQTYQCFSRMKEVACINNVIVTNDKSWEVTFDINKVGNATSRLFGNRDFSVTIGKPEVENWGTTTLYMTSAKHELKVSYMKLPLNHIDLTWKVSGVDIGTASGICGNKIPKDNGVDACASREKASQMTDIEDCCDRYKNCEQVYEMCKQENCAENNRVSTVQCMDFEPTTKAAEMCECNDRRFKGKFCDKCADSYYGWPLCENHCHESCTDSGGVCNNNGECVVNGQIVTKCYLEEDCPKGRNCPDYRKDCFGVGCSADADCRGFGWCRESCRSKQKICVPFAKDNGYCGYSGCHESKCDEDNSCQKYDVEKITRVAKICTTYHVQKIIGTRTVTLQTKRFTTTQAATLMEKAVETITKYRTKIVGFNEIVNVIQKATAVHKAQNSTKFGTMDHHITDNSDWDDDDHALATNISVGNPKIDVQSAVAVFKLAADWKKQVFVGHANLMPTEKQQPEKIDKFDMLPALGDDDLDTIENIKTVLKGVHVFQNHFATRVITWNKKIGITGTTKDVGVCVPKARIEVPSGLFKCVVEDGEERHVFKFETIANCKKGQACFKNLELPKAFTTETCSRAFVLDFHDAHRGHFIFKNTATPCAAQIKLVAVGGWDNHSSQKKFDAYVMMNGKSTWSPWKCQPATTQPTCTTKIANPMSGAYASGGCADLADEGVCQLRCQVGMKLDSKYGGAVCDNGQWTHIPRCVRACDLRERKELICTNPDKQYSTCGQKQEDRVRCKKDLKIQYTVKTVKVSGALCNSNNFVRIKVCMQADNSHTQVCQVSGYFKEHGPTVQPYTFDVSSLRRAEYSTLTVEPMTHPACRIYSIDAEMEVLSDVCPGRSCRTEWGTTLQDGDIDDCAVCVDGVTMYNIAEGRCPEKFACEAGKYPKGAKNKCGCDECLPFPEGKCHTKRDCTGKYAGYECASIGGDRLGFKSCVRRETCRPCTDVDGDQCTKPVRSGENRAQCGTPCVDGRYADRLCTPSVCWCPAVENETINLCQNNLQKKYPGIIKRMRPAVPVIGEKIVIYLKDNVELNSGSTLACHWTTTKRGVPAATTGSYNAQAKMIVCTWPSASWLDQLDSLQGIGVQLVETLHFKLRPIFGNLIQCYSEKQLPNIEACPVQQCAVKTTIKCADPCAGKCATDSRAVCCPDQCGECTARWFVHGKDVTAQCSTGTCRSNNDCPARHYCTTYMTTTVAPTMVTTLVVPHLAKFGIAIRETQDGEQLAVNDDGEVVALTDKHLEGLHEAGVQFDQNGKILPLEVTSEVYEEEVEEEAGFTLKPTSKFAPQLSLAANLLGTTTAVTDLVSRQFTGVVKVLESRTGTCMPVTTYRCTRDVDCNNGYTCDFPRYCGNVAGQFGYCKKKDIITTQGCISKKDGKPLSPGAPDLYPYHCYTCSKVGGTLLAVNPQCAPCSADQTTLPSASPCVCPTCVSKPSCPCKKRTGHTVPANGVDPDEKCCTCGPRGGALVCKPTLNGGSCPHVDQGLCLQHGGVVMKDTCACPTCVTACPSQVSSKALIKPGKTDTNTGGECCKCEMKQDKAGQYYSSLECKNQARCPFLHKTMCKAGAYRNPPCGCPCCAHKQYLNFQTTLQFLPIDCPM